MSDFEENKDQNPESENQEQNPESVPENSSEQTPADGEAIAESQPEPDAEAPVESEQEPSAEAPAESQPEASTEAPAESKPESGAETSAEAKPEAIETQDGPIPLEAARAKGKEPRNKFQPTNAQSNSAARKLTYIVLFQGLLLLVTVVLDVMFFFKSNDLQKEVVTRDTKIKSVSKERDDLQTDLNKARETNKKLNEDIKRLTNDKAGLEAELATLSEIRNNLIKDKSDLNKQLGDLQSEHTKKLQELAEVSATLKKLEEDYKTVVDEKAAKEKELEKANANYTELKKKYDEIFAAYEIAKKSQAINQEQFATVYEAYKAPAGKMIDSLAAIQTTLESGTDFRSFNETLKMLEIPYQELITSLNQTSINFTSLKLMKMAYDNYQESLDRWKALARLNPTGKAGTWATKTIKFEDPIATAEDRPWVDHLQYIWKQTASYIKACRILLTTQDGFLYDQCPVCDGKHSVPCIKCDTTGKCFSCKGQGFTELAGVVIKCEVCEGSTRCSLCGGGQNIVCPVCQFK
ncbi:MAG: hypothetical protein WC980_08285 [Candidatus Brocadiia bacterium]